MKKHPVVHFEIGCHGGEKTREFFAELFGWDISGRDAGMTIKAGDAGHASWSGQLRLASRPGGQHHRNLEAGVNRRP